MRKLRLLLLLALRIKDRLGSRLRKMQFRGQVLISDGRTVLDSSVRFDHAVRFQGRGTVVVEKNVLFGYSLAGAYSLPILIQPRMKDAVIHIGEATNIMNGTEIFAVKSVRLGKRCLVGARTVILDSDFHGLDPRQRNGAGISKPVEIQDNVWIGMGVMILKGVTIGKDAVIGASCVVTKDVPAGAIVIGNPMRVAGSVYERQDLDVIES
jgi:acetyltransferase-like isoleucine patch superfamily enzyme